MVRNVDLSLRIGPWVPAFAGMTMVSDNLVTASRLTLPFQSLVV